MLHETLVQNNGWGVSACLWVQVVLCLFLCGELFTSVCACMSLSLIMKVLQQAAMSSTILILHFYILLTFTGVL